MDTEDNLTLDQALQFFIQNRGKPSREVDKVQRSKCTEVFIKTSEEGLPSGIIKTLAESIIFMDNYDLNTRRKLLYCLLPQSGEFPYTIIPLAISTAMSESVSPMLQNAALIWLAGLLDYQIVDAANKFIRICYPSLFGLLTLERMCPIVCKMLARISRREDVTPLRVQMLMKLKKKLGFTAPISSLIRVYQVFRPDLVVVPLIYHVRYAAYPNVFKEHLANARRRIEEEFEASETHIRHDEIWPDIKRTKRMNPLTQNNAIPAPEVLLYTDRIEEKKMKKIYILEYKKIKYMISDLHKWSDWHWPNNSSCLLWKPALIPLFKPHDLQIKVSITNWLELALRTEIIDQVGPRNIKRQLNLLEACIQLVKHTDSLIPAVYQFLVEYLPKWDQHTFMSKILELISVAFIPFSLPAMFFESIFEHFCNILSTAPIALWCAIVNAFSNLNVTWALEASSFSQKLKKGRWPLHTEGFSPLEGIFFLTQRLERVFLATILRLGPHPLILNAIFSYYLKTNKACCEKLNLPLFIVPSPEFVLVSLSNGELSSINRIGLLFCKLKENVAKVKKMEPDGSDRYLKNVSLYQVKFINTSLTFYLDSLYTSKSFSKKWLEILSPFFANHFWENLLNLDNIRHFGSCGRALVYSSLIAEDYKYGKIDINRNEQRQALIKTTLEKLNDRNLKNISTCISTFVQ